MGKLYLCLALLCGAVLLSYWTSKETAKTDAAAEAALTAETPPPASESPQVGTSGMDAVVPPATAGALPEQRNEPPAPPPPASADAPPTSAPGYPPDATGFPPAGSPYAGAPTPGNPDPVPYTGDTVPYVPPPVYPDGGAYEGDIPPPPSQYDPNLMPDDMSDFGAPPPEEGF